MPKSPRIFISYAREDRARAAQIYDRLAAEGFSPWMDSQDIIAGDRWENAIKQALHRSDFMIVLLSQNSINKRGSVQTEIKEAISLLQERPPGAVFLIPVRLDDCSVPQPMANFHFVDLFQKSGWPQLLQALKHGTADKGSIEDLRREIREAEETNARKSYIFVAMSFNPVMEDIYHYAIRRAVDANGYLCERIDQSAFTGSILSEIKGRIETAAAVIADLTGANPNVYLELGYAWGKDVPAILIVQDTKSLCFDVKDQRCIEYSSIKMLEQMLTRELAALKSKQKI